MKKVLISGSTGFVGAVLGEYLKQDYEIYNLVRNDAGKNNQVFWDNIGDLTSLEIDTYVHLAGKAHDLKNTSKAEEYFHVNVDLTKALFDVFLKSAATTFIYFSSVKAVADSITEVLYEDSVPNPQSVYGQSKLKAEEFLLSQKLPANKRLFILRPCMIHGPGNKGNLNLLYKFIKTGIPYPLGAFENSRSVLSISNLNFVIEKLISDITLSGGVFNIADDAPLSTNEMIYIIATALGSKPRIWKLHKKLIEFMAAMGDKLHLPLNTESLRKLTEDFVVSNDKIKNALKIEDLPTSSRDGLTNTIKAF